MGVSSFGLLISINGRAAVFAKAVAGQCLPFFIIFRFSVTHDKTLRLESHAVTLFGLLVVLRLTPQAVALFVLLVGLRLTPHAVGLFGLLVVLRLTPQAVGLFGLLVVLRLTPGCHLCTSQAVIFGLDPKISTRGSA